MTATWILGAVTVFLAVWTVWQIIRKPRHSGNDLLIVATLFLVWATALVSDLQDDPDSETATLLVSGTLVLGALAAIGTEIYLLVNGTVVVRREGFNLATVVPTVFGIGMLAAIAGLWVGAYLLGNGPVEHLLTAQILLFVVAPLASLTVAMILVQLIAFTVYAVLYGQITRPRHADAVVVLGAGLNGTEPTPLLAAPCRPRHHRPAKTAGRRGEGTAHPLRRSGGRKRRSPRPRPWHATTRERASPGSRWCWRTGQPPQKRTCGAHGNYSVRTHTSSW